MKNILYLFLALNLSLKAQTQDSTGKVPEQSTPHQFSFKSPYKLSTKLDVPLSLGSTGLGGTGFLYSLLWHIPAPPASGSYFGNSNQVNVFDRDATHFHSETAEHFSDATLFASFSMPFFLLINPNCRKDVGTIAVMYSEVLETNVGLTEIFKATIHRPRPFMYNPANASVVTISKSDFQSFFSGHADIVAGTSFFFATTYAAYNPDSRLKPLVWAICAALPAATGVLRVEAGEHYWSDVIVGYAIGAAVGVAVPYLHSVKWKFNKQKFKQPKPL